MPVRLVFETHAWSVDNEQGLATGWLSGCVSERGEDEARQLGARRLAQHVDVVYTSDLRRAVQTAELAFADTARPIRWDWRLRECNYGELNGCPVEQLEAARPSHVDEPFPGGESYRQVVARMRSFLQDLRGSWSGADVVLIGHTASRWALDHLLLGQRLENLVAAPFSSSRAGPTHSSERHDRNADLAS